MKSSKRRLAAAALRFSALVFLTAVAMVPVASLLNRVFNSSWSVNWREMLLGTGVLSGCIFCFIFVTGSLEMWAALRRRRKNDLVFPGVMWLRGIYLVAIAMGLTIMAGTYKEGDEWCVVALPFGFVLLGVFAWPRAIRITKTEIRQRGKLFFTKKIGLGEIESVAHDPSSNEVVVFGKNGERIVHTSMLTDAGQFRELMESVVEKETAVLGDRA